MSAPSNTDSPYYFVPFGRERGGYLELLGLPPTATDVEARKKDGEFRKEAERALKGARKNLKEQLAENLISQKEFDEELDKLKKANNDAIVQLNELKGKFDAIQAERRGGQSEDATIWFEILPSFAEDATKAAAELARVRGDYFELLGLAVDADVSEGARTEHVQYLTHPYEVVRRGIEAARAEHVRYLIEVERSFKTRRKELREKLAAGEITQEALDAQVRQLEEERDRARQKLSELKAAFEALPEEQRQRQLKIFWQFLLRPRQLSNVPVEMLAAIEERWINSAQSSEQIHPDSWREIIWNQFEQAMEQTWRRYEELNELSAAAADLTRYDELWEQANATYEQWAALPEERDRFFARWETLSVHEQARMFELYKDGYKSPAEVQQLRAAQDARNLEDLLPSHKFSSGVPVDLATISSLVVERDLIRLLTADALWAKVPYTNRKYWSETIMAWAREMAGLTVRLNHEAKGEKHLRGAVEYPSLCQPTDMVIVMKSQLTLPQVDETITEAVINKWLKKVGDRVEIDEPILQFTMGEYNETRLVSHVDGTLTEMKVEEGKPFKPTDVIAVISRKTI